MSQQTAALVQSHTIPVEVPTLEAGDHLTRYEFERRYEAMTEVKKAELIEGVVYMPSPVRMKSHGQPHSHIVTWLGTYAASTLGVNVADNATVRLDLDNEPQPDVTLRIETALGGRSQISADDYLEGAPELVAEVAASSASYDLHEKLRAYRRNGVQEYVVWRVYDKQVDWFHLLDGGYARLTPDADGILHSHVFPGLRLAVAALLTDDLATVLAEVQKGIGTSEHAAFVERLHGE
ncbi:MAG: Uma2 family endonuclease [Deltaproteobacteria bacterium]|nr:Uma2 family endonuclease [Deltaproteobacteria bacterium]